MEPISNVDRLVLLLRQRLQERSKAGAAPRKDDHSAVGEPDTLKGLAAIEGLDERQLRRALIQNILADQFGAGLINDAKFQQVVDRVVETIEGDGEASKLIAKVLVELRASTVR